MVLTKPQINRLSHLEGKLRRAEGELLASLAAQVDADHAIVEVGSFKGKSACYMASGATAGNGAHVYAIDLWMIGGQRGKNGGRVKQPYDKAETYRGFQEQIRSLGFGNAITPIMKHSLDAAADWDKPIGLMFIDAEHNYDACLADIDAWSPHIVPGGWIALHDYSGSFPGVIQAADERIRGSAEWSDIQTADTVIVARRSQ